MTDWQSYQDAEPLDCDQRADAEDRAAMLAARLRAQGAHVVIAFRASAGRLLEPLVLVDLEERRARQRQNGTG